MTFEQGAIVVISTLGTVTSVLFWLYVNSMKKQIAVLRADVEECKDDRDEIWKQMRDMPNPRFCTIANCPLKPAGSPGAPVQMTFSSDPPNQNTPPS